MINNIVLVGRTTRNIELKENRNRTHYVQFTLAVNRPYKDEQGSQQTDFIHCIAWNKTAETVSKYVSKGNLIGVEGRLQVRSYENGSPALSSEALSHPQSVGKKAGVRQYLSEVVVNRLTFLESKKSSASPEPVEPFNHQGYSSIESHVNPFENLPMQSPKSNYDNPFETATTLAGGLKTTNQTDVSSISVSDDDLPF
ncbi:single-stranded DNA-binding protein [Turicibacter sanguinis]|uniref:single-stranded DNA-binding protein n=1 Tax=Turicibacter sanguinis TaxID=154288 RepID=UPI0018A9B5BF|nr:single-stranded DNA-binding protein [Turicibacter sanguinis]MDB8564272.1 single-stranded DNA-binding protein [Turicibacter sanguinis]